MAANHLDLSYLKIQLGIVVILHHFKLLTYLRWCMFWTCHVLCFKLHNYNPLKSSIFGASIETLAIFAILSEDANYLPKILVTISWFSEIDSEKSTLFFRESFIHAKIFSIIHVVKNFQKNYIYLNLSHVSLNFNILSSGQRVKKSWTMLWHHSTSFYDKLQN